MSRFASFFVVDPRLTASGNTWVTIGRLLLMLIAATFVIEFAYERLLINVLASGFIKLTPYLVIGLYSKKLFIVLFATWFALHSGSRRTGIFSSLAFRKASVVWFFWMFLGLVILFAAIFIAPSRFGDTLLHPSNINVIIRQITNNINQSSAIALVATILGLINSGCYDALAFGLVLPALLNSGNKLSAMLLTTLFAMSTTSFVYLLFFVPHYVAYATIFAFNFLLCTITIRSGSVMPALIGALLFQGILSFARSP